jgi:hypothetical protein
MHAAFRGARHAHSLEVGEIVPPGPPVDLARKHA